MNTWQKYRSYIQRIEVERCASEHNKKLVVAIQNGRYVLNADHANYSFASLHRVFQQAFNRINLANRKRGLVLGCGAGSIPSIIYKERGLSFPIDAVEIDEKVIELGKKYFDLDNYPNLFIEIADAFHFMETCSQTYDLICVDVFNGIEVPEAFLSQQFFERCKRVLETEGELLFNFVAFNHETKALVPVIEEKLGMVYSKVKTYRIEGVNRVFWAKK